MTSSQTASDKTAERAAFIQAMRGVANSVTVVTTLGPAGMHGATVSAFSSVSADPPSVLVCLKTGSRIARMVAANHAFCVNVLPPHCQHIAERFAGCHDHQVTDRFEGIDCIAVPGPGPAIAGATHFACGLQKTVAFASHEIFIGHVIAVGEGAPTPLAYLNGTYHRVVPDRLWPDRLSPEQHATE